MNIFIYPFELFFLVYENIRSEKNMEDEIFFIARARILGNVEKGEFFLIFFQK
jgi:hypothetical protein